MWNSIKNYIISVLETVKTNLDQESIDSVKHYLDHEEYEMAFEGLFIEIMKLNSRPNIDFIEGRKFGKLLKLDEESVFDFNFWRQFENYCLANNN